MFEVANAGSAAERARWLAELADALDEARDLVRQLGIEGGGQDFDPEWIKNIPWKLSA